MKFKPSLAQFSAMALITVVVLITSCEKTVNSPVKKTDSAEIISTGDFDKGNGKGKGKHKDEGDPTPDPIPDPFVVTFQLYQVDDSDPLFRFSFSQSGELILLESDPNVASWGTDFWGTWFDPFPYANSEVNYIRGLTNTTYRFQQLPDNKIAVTKILIVQPYPSGTPITTVSHPGIYILNN